MRAPRAVPSRGIEIRDEHIFSDTAARDAYFSANPDELKAGLYVSAGSQLFKRVAGQWADLTPVIQGQPGSETDFSEIPTDHLVAIGLDNKPYDSGLVKQGRNLKTEGSIQAGPSSLLIGPKFRMSSGVNAVAFTLGTGQDAVGINTTYDSQGSTYPFYYKLAPMENLTVNSKTDQVVTSPFELQYVTFGDNLTYDFMFIPAEAGEMRVRYWLGTAITDEDLIFDEIREVTQAEVDAGVPVQFGVGNKYILPQGQNLYVQFTGVDLVGGYPDSGPFAGQLLPYFVSQIHPYRKITFTSFGWYDYNNSLPAQSISKNTWTTLLNDGEGLYTNKGYPPHAVGEMLDPLTGRILFDDLDPGDEVYIRHTLSVKPNANGVTYFVRHLLGEGAGQYSLPIGRPTKLEQGGGTPTGDFVVDTRIYIGDNNTLIGGAVPQIQLSGTAEVTYKGAYISVTRRG